jgi:hypothetical protein
MTENKSSEQKGESLYSAGPTGTSLRKHEELVNDTLQRRRNEEYRIEKELGYRPAFMDNPGFDPYSFPRKKE